MKTKLMLAALCLSALCLAESSEKNSVEFLGVDFSCTDVIGADESLADFQKAFYGINTLMYTEASKYNVAEFLYLDVESIDTEAAISRVELNDDACLFKDKERVFSVDSIVAAYPTSEGHKLLIIADELNKSQAMGTFKAVIFNGQTKEVLTKRNMRGVAKGFGLRNFWAGALYDALKTEKLKKWQ